MSEPLELGRRPLEKSLSGYEVVTDIGTRILSIRSCPIRFCPYFQSPGFCHLPYVHFADVARDYVN